MTIEHKTIQESLSELATYTEELIEIAKERRRLKLGLAADAPAKPKRNKDLSEAERRERQSRRDKARHGRREAENEKNRRPRDDGWDGHNPM